MSYSLSLNTFILCTIRIPLNHCIRLFLKQRMTICRELLVVLYEEVTFFHTVIAVLISSAVCERISTLMQP